VYRLNFLQRITYTIVYFKLYDKTSSHSIHYYNRTSSKKEMEVQQIFRILTVFDDLVNVVRETYLNKLRENIK